MTPTLIRFLLGLFANHFTNVYLASFPKISIDILISPPSVSPSPSRWYCTWVDTKFWRRQWHPTPVLLPGKSHGWRSLVGCSPWGHKESDTTEGLHFHFSLSCIGEGNGSPLQCSCLENTRGGGACWVAIYGVAQIRTQLKRLSSGSRHKVQSCGDLEWTEIFLIIIIWKSKTISHLYYWEQKIKWSDIPSSSVFHVIT